MEANVYNTTGRKIGSILFCNTYDLQDLFFEYIVGSVRFYNNGLKMSAKTLKEVKAVAESHSFLRKDFSVIID